MEAIDETNPSGWYEFESKEQPTVTVVMWWDGKYLRPTKETPIGRGELPREWCTNFRPLLSAAEPLAILETIVCTVPPDDGVVLLSNDGPSHYDSEAECVVYDHEHFSPLGDALIKLHDVLQGTRQPDGGEPLTSEWMTAVGFEDDGDGLPYWTDDRGRLLETGTHWEWYVYGQKLPEEAWPTNRFQLRRLCSSLAIKLSE